MLNDCSLSNHFKIIKNTLKALTLCGSLLMCSSCNHPPSLTTPVINTAEINDTHITTNKKTDLKLGVVSGPYGDMFTETILPLFLQKEYNVELVYYNNYDEPNFALSNGEIDLNMFQNYKYLNNFKFENNLDLSAIAEIPTAPMGIYSQKHESIDELTDEAVIAIPDDTTNLARALSVLSSAEIIALDPAVDKAKVTLENIIVNNKNLSFVTLDANTIAESLECYDMALINGNYVINRGINISEALFNEIITDHAYLNVIAVRNNDLVEPFVLDLIDVLRSREFIDKIMNENSKYCSYIYPCNFSDTIS